MRLLAALGATVAAAASITISLPATPNPFLLPADTHATLSSLGKVVSVPLSAANTFNFHNVTDGSYLADIHCRTDAYRPIRVDVVDGAIQAWDTFRGNDWGNKGEVLPVTNGALEARVLGKKEYFAERPAFSVLSVLKNPMILMGIVSMGLFFGMPYLMDNLDPELKAELENRQRENPPGSVLGGGGANPLGNFDMAAYLAGSNKKEDEPVRR